PAFRRSDRHRSMQSCFAPSQKNPCLAGYSLPHDRFPKIARPGSRPPRPFSGSYVTPRQTRSLARPEGAFKPPAGSTGASGRHWWGPLGLHNLRTFDAKPGSRLHNAARRSGGLRMRGTVRARQILLRPHFDQPRSGPAEFLRLIALLGAVKRVRFGVGRRDQFHVHVIERIDENDESLGGVAVVEGHDRN